MRTGTKSILWGYHAFWLHPFFVAEAWRRIYGFPLDPRLWVAFFVHDIGYLGKAHMDDLEGESHPFVGATIMHWLFDCKDPYTSTTVDGHDPAAWYKFVLYHSRSLARVYFAPISKLAYADKLAFLLYPQWLLKILYALSGEFEEYRRHSYDVQDHLEPLGWDSWYNQAAAANLKTMKEIDYVAS